MKIPGIIGIDDMFYYEEHAWATLRWVDGIHLDIWEYNESTFTNPKEIELTWITNDFSVQCHLEEDISNDTGRFKIDECG